MIPGKTMVYNGSWRNQGLHWFLEKPWFTIVPGETRVYNGSWRNQGL